MKKSSLIIASAIIAAGLAVLGFFIKRGIDNIAFKDREVSVRGLAEREVKANRVTWPIQFELPGDNLQLLYDNVTHLNGVVSKFLTDSGIEQSEISIGAPSLYNASTNLYSNNQRFKYTLSSTVTVTTDKVDLVQELLSRQGELLKEGVPFSNSYINYEYTSLNDIKPEMIAEATKNARAAADKFAEDSDSKIGKIKTAYQGQFSIDSSDSNPIMKHVRVVTTIVYYIED